MMRFMTDSLQSVIVYRLEQLVYIIKVRAWNKKQIYVI